MDNYSRKSLWGASPTMLVALLLLFVAADGARGQWTKVATGIAVGLSEKGGLSFNEGILWLATPNSIYQSNDSGLTWKPVGTAGGTMSDLVFYDHKNGILASEDGTFLTTDGGVAWTQVSSSSFSACFGNTASVLAVAGRGTNSQALSTDGGVTWTFGPSLGFSTCARYRRGVVSFFGGPNGVGYMSWTSDQGITWHKALGGIGYDSYGFVIDSCDDNLIYVSHEDFYLPTDHESKILVSIDRGDSWQTEMTMPDGFFTGSIAEGRRAVYCSTDADGIYRSVDSGQTWKSIGGPNIVADTRLLAAINDNIIIAGDAAGNIWRTTNSGGDSILTSSSNNSTFSVSSTSLFEHDTISCDSLTRSVLFSRAGCLPPSVSSLSIIGADSASFRASNLSYDSISVTLHGVKQGDQSAKLILVLDNGSSDSITLAGFINLPPNTLRVSSATLFQSDTIFCDSVTHSVSFSRGGCSPPSVSRWSIIGPDSASFKAGNLSYDSILVTLRGIKQGAQNAQLVLALDNGSSDTIHLAGFVNLPPNTLSASPATIFQTDSITCDSLTHSISFSRGGCSPPSVSSYSIIGADSSSFEASNLAYDSILVTLRGIKQGAQNAQLVLTLNNGSSDTVSLAGYVNISPSALTLSTADVKTDTLGATVAVPITINGLEHAEDVELVLHYDGAMDYLGSFSPTGAKLDVAGQQWPGRSMLHIPGAAPGVVAGYAKFNAWNDSNTDAYATFDSLNVLTAISPCEYGLPEAATSTISAPSGCGISMLSQWVHLGEQPKFVVQPNPTEGDVSITSSLDLGTVTIAIYDMLGSERSRWEENMSGNTPVTLALPEADGVYTVVLQATNGTYDLRVVRHR